MYAIGPALKSLRKEANVTQTAMAKALAARGIRIGTKGGVSRLERRPDAKVAILRTYAEVCTDAGVPVTVSRIEARAQEIFSETCSNN